MEGRQRLLFLLLWRLRHDLSHCHLPDHGYHAAFAFTLARLVAGEERGGVARECLSNRLLHPDCYLPSFHDNPLTRSLQDHSQERDKHA